MMNAFDRVSWNFISWLLNRFGFHPHFVSWILNNLTSAWLSILINGNPYGFFQAKHGLKQGDPLSPFLFILVSEALRRGLQNLLSLNKLRSFATGRGCISILHLAFADDVVAFTRGDWWSVKNSWNYIRKPRAKKLM